MKIVCNNYDPVSVMVLSPFFMSGGICWHVHYMWISMLFYVLLSIYLIYVLKNNQIPTIH